MSIKLEFQGRRLRKRRGTAGADGARAAPSQARAGHPQPPRAPGDRGGRGSWPSRHPAPKGQVQGCEKRKPRSWCKGAAGAGVREHPLLEPGAGAGQPGAALGPQPCTAQAAGTPGCRPLARPLPGHPHSHHSPSPRAKATRNRESLCCCRGPGAAAQPAGPLGTGPGHSTGHRRDREPCVLIRPTRLAGP